MNAGGLSGAHLTSVLLRLNVGLKSPERVQTYEFCEEANAANEDVRVRACACLTQTFGCKYTN
eukprot:9743257-Heterocapsa_arctica.AAC.1